MKVLVTGANGQLGKCIKDASSNFPELEFIFASREELDITNNDFVTEIFTKNDFDFCINTAAYTNVEKAESESEQAFLINAEAIKNLARCCKDTNTVLIQVSTDYVFDGKKTTPYTEEDSTNPINVYGASKLKGEQYVQDICNNYFIIRTSWLYSQYGHNFYNSMLRFAKEGKELKITTEQTGTPTNANYLAENILQIINKKFNKYGIYNVSNTGKATWYDFAQEILIQANLINTTTLAKTDFYRTFAKRPKYSVLTLNKSNRELNVALLDWRESLKKITINEIMDQKNTEDIDLLQVIKAIKKTFRRWLHLIFEALNFIKKKWIVILVLLIVGFSYGYYKEYNQVQSKNVKVLVRINYDAVDYVYTSIELLDKKIKENDYIFLNKIGLKPNMVTKIELEPVIKINEILNQFDANNRNLDILLKNIDFEEEEDELKLLETFTSAYKEHILEITTNNDSTNVVDLVLEYLNNTPLINELKKVGLLNLKSNLESNKKTLSQIDKILDSYSENQSLPSPLAQMFVVDKNFSIHTLIEKKAELLFRVKREEQDLIYGNNVVVFINQPELTLINKRLLDNKKVIYPIGLIITFLILAYFRYTYFRLKRIAYHEVN